jgi:tRNA (cytidine32/uridine32-2'-O)-methyltransferase
METLSRIRAVLIHPTHPGNVGATARALKNMGLSDLHLVAPEDYPSPEATARAADAEDVLARAVVCADLDQALEGCHFVVGTSARSRRIAWPMSEPTAAAERVLAEATRGTVALLFGTERTGLTNAELDRCHMLVHIPTSPVYPSLNLASAVQILAYEVYRTALAGGAPVEKETAPPASEHELERFYRHLEEIMIATEFLDPAKPRFLMRRLRRLYNRAQPDQNEINILRGILTAVQKGLKLDKNTKE